MLRRFAVAALLVSVRFASAADGSLAEFAPPGTRAVIGLHVRSILDSPLVQSLTAEFLKAAGGKMPATALFPGFDPLKDLDEVVIASTMEGANPPSVVICRGRFPVDELAKGAVVYRGVPIRAANDKDGVAVLDPGTVLAGTVGDLRAAIDRRERHAGELSPALAQRVARLSGKYAIWGAGSVPKAFHAPAGSPEALNAFDRFDFGIGLENGLNMTATLHARSPEEIQKMAATFQMIEMMAKAQPDASGSKFETHVENGSLTLSLAVPEEALKKALEQQRGTIAQAIAQAQGQRAAVSQETPSPAPVLRREPVGPKETVIVRDQEGTSVQVTLPGKR
jgi:hypothetical protein